MLEIKSLEDWESVKSYFNNKDYDVFYDIDNYTRMLVFTICETLSSVVLQQLNDVFGGDWKLSDNEDFKILELHFETIKRSKNIKNRSF